MFRPMRRWKQQLSDEDCIAILKNEPRGILSVLGDDGYPYGIPMNHWYCEADGKLYFHGAKTGHKIDAISQCDKVSYCVHDEGYREESVAAAYQKCCSVRQDSAGERCGKGTGNLHAPLPEIY